MIAFTGRREGKSNNRNRPAMSRFRSARRRHLGKIFRGATSTARLRSVPFDGADRVLTEGIVKQFPTVRAS